MSWTKKELTRRTHQFAARVFRFVETLPRNMASYIISQQLLRAAASVASNYRAVNRAKSDRDFCNKLKTVLEEADECHFWLEFMDDTGLASAGNQKEYLWLVNEANELTAIFVASVNTAVSNRKRRDAVRGSRRGQAEKNK
jgi:four helix bundle protein